MLVEVDVTRTGWWMQQHMPGHSVVVAEALGTLVNVNKTSLQSH